MVHPSCRTLMVGQRNKSVTGRRRTKKGRITEFRKLTTAGGKFE